MPWILSTAMKFKLAYYLLMFHDNLNIIRTALWPYPILSFFPSFSFSDVLCDPIDLIWRKGTPIEAMTGRTAPSSHGLLAEVLWGLPRL